MKSLKIRVLIADGSAVMRKMLGEILSQDSSFELIGTAPDATIARNKLVGLSPDVVLLDCALPGMDGIEFLKKIMHHVPTPVLFFITASPKDALLSSQALAAGAREVMIRPEPFSWEPPQDFADNLRARIRSMAHEHLARSSAVVPSGPGPAMIAIGASTGGTEALKDVLTLLPREMPGIVMVQHMPPLFTHLFAAQLNEVCPMHVREARQGDRIQPGLALVAPGDYHMEVVSCQGIATVRLHQKPPLHGVRPAVDVLLHSVAQQCGKHAIGLILTGMGRDGAAGLLAMRKAGAVTIVQDEASSVVFGMPKVAMESGAAQHILPLNKIAPLLMQTAGIGPSRKIQ